VGGPWTSKKTDGDVLRFFYSWLNQKTLSKIQLSVPGNHDLWDCGDPLGHTFEGTVFCSPSNADNGGWGIGQYYGQDTLVFTPEQPMDFSTPPSGMGWSVVAPPDFFFFYTQIGDLGFIGFNGAPAATTPWYS